MREVNEVQTKSGYDQDIPLEHLKSLVRIGALVHVQTTVLTPGIHRYFSTVEDAHEYVVSDLRYDTSETLDEAAVGQIV